MMPDEHARRERKIDEAREETFPPADTTVVCRSRCASRESLSR